MAMDVFVRNRAGIPNKHVRFIKWKLRKVKEKFNWLKEAQVFLKREGVKQPTYYATIVLKVPGKELVANHNAQHLPKLWKEIYEDTQRYLKKYKNRNLEGNRRLKSV